MIDRHEQKTRRQVVAGVAGVGTAGALAAGAALIPTADPRGAGDAVDAKAEPGKTPGYRVTAHVLRYYQTART